MEYSVDVEKAIISCLIMDEKNFEHASDLRPSDFSDKTCAGMFTVLRGMYVDGVAIDWLTLRGRLDGVGNLGDGSATGLNKLSVTALDAMLFFDYLPMPLNNFPSYIEILKNESARRQILDLRAAIDARVDLDPMQLLGFLENKIESISIQRSSKRSMKEIIISTVEQISSKGVSVRTGFGIDRFTNGFSQGDLVVVAGRPGMGKTTLAINIAVNCVKLGTPALFFSIEMTAEALLRKVISNVCNIDGTLLKNDRLNAEQWDKVNAFIGKLYKSDLFIIDDPRIGVGNIKTILKKMIAVNGVKIVFIDYLQLMMSESNEANRNAEIGAITAGLKRLAKEFKIPIVLMSQLSRAVEMRPDKRPVLSDLRDSGNIEQDADIVVFPFRKEYYSQSKTSEGELVVAKNREGPVGSSPITFQAIFSRFEDMEKTESIPDSINGSSEPKTLLDKVKASQKRKVKAGNKENPEDREETA